MLGTAQTLPRTIPRVIIQVWIGSKPIPSKWKLNSEFLKARAESAQYRYIFIDNNNYRSILATHFPQYIAFFDALPYIIMKCDMLRYMLLHTYGGLYVDLDYRLVGDINKLFNETGKNNIRLTINTECKIANGLILSTQHNPVWIDILNTIVQRYNTYPLYKRWLNRIEYVCDVTGPTMLSKHISGSVDIIDTELVVYVPIHTSLLKQYPHAVFLYDDDVDSSWSGTRFIYYNGIYLCPLLIVLLLLVSMWIYIYIVYRPSLINNDTFPTKVDNTINGVVT